MATKSPQSRPRQAARPQPANDRRTERPPVQENNGPVGHVRHYPVEAAIWLNYTDDGKSMYSVSFQRSYKSREGEWKRSTSFSGTDLLVLAECAQQAYHQIEEMRAASRGPVPVHQPRSNGHVTDEDVPF